MSRTSNGEASSSRRSASDCQPRPSAPSNQRAVDPKIQLNRIKIKAQRRAQTPVKERHSYPYSSSTGYILRKSYAFTVRYIEQGRLDEIKALLPEATGQKGKHDNPFIFVLILFYSLSGELTKAVKNKIRLHGAALHYAYLKGVPELYLIGFIHQMGGNKRLARKYAKAHNRLRTNE